MKLYLSDLCAVGRALCLSLLCVFLLALPAAAQEQNAPVDEPDAVTQAQMVAAQKVLSGGQQSGKVELSVASFMSGTQSIVEFFASKATLAAQRLHSLTATMRQFPADLAQFFTQLEQSGFDLWATLFHALVWLSVGAFFEQLFRRFSRRLRFDQTASRLRQQVIAFLFDGVGLLIFALIGGWPLLMSNQANIAAQLVTGTLFAALLAVRLFALVGRIPLAPFSPDLRMVALGDEAARRLYRQSVGIAALSILIAACASLLGDGGLSDESVLVFTLVSRSLVSGLLILVCIDNRASIATILRADRKGRQRGRSWRSFASVWHFFAILYIGLSWFGTSILLLLDRPEAGIYAIVSFLLIMMLVALCLIMDDWAAAADARDQAAGLAVPPAEDLPSFPQFFARFGQSVASLVVILALIRLWSGPWDGLVNDKVARLLPALTQLAVTLVIAYMLWHLVVIGSARMLHRAAVPRGDQAQADILPQGDRISTLMPLIRNTMLATIATIAVLIGLSAIGVDVVPLLAGAGVVGLAFGMGSQTLVRDVISGVFFLIDDAFRVGELVDVGIASGTIEKSGVRSLQIRHYLGELHTVPFGEIKTISNLSREWIAKQLEFSLPIQTDLDMLQDRFAALAERLMADPEHGQKFVVPLIYSGIVGVEEQQMIVRVIFKCRPGEQFILRNVVYDGVRRMMLDAGISFAVRELRLVSDGADAHSETAQEGAMSTPSAGA